MKLKNILLTTATTLILTGNAINSNAQSMNENNQTGIKTYFSTTQQLISGTTLQNIIKANETYNGGTLSENASDTPEGKAYYAIGMALGNGDLAKGINQFREVYNGEETSSENWARLSDEFYIGELTELSNEAADSAIAKINSSETTKENKQILINTNLNKAYNFMTMNKTNSAIEVLENILKIDSNNTNVLFGLAYSNYLTNNFKESINYCNRLNEIKPEANTYALLSKIYFESKNEFLGKEMQYKAEELKQLKENN